MWASVVVAQALTAALTGVAVDADGRSVAGAAVEIVCGGAIVRVTTDASGSFSAPPATPACRVTVSLSGFDPATRSCAAGRPAGACRIALQPARRHEVVDVTAPLLTLATVARGGVGATAWTAEQLRMAGPDLASWLSLATLDAGHPPGNREVRMDGMAAGTMPPTRSVSAVRVNDDPFSAEATGVDQVRITLDPSAPLSSWTLEIRPPLSRRQRSDPLTGAPAPKASDPAVTFGAGFPGRWRVSMMASVQRSRLQESPSFVDGPPGRESLSASLEARHETTTVHTSTIVAHRSVTASYLLTNTRLSISNAGVGGRAGIPYASSLTREGWSHLFTVRAARPGWHVRGGIAIDHNVADDRTVARDEGVVVAGRLTSGAPDRVGERGRTTSWVARATAESADAGRWLIGVESMRRQVTSNVRYNPGGQTFLSASGAWLDHVRREDPGPVAGDEITAAAFAERRLVAGRRLWLRAGLRVDWQRYLGFAVNPRVSWAMPVAGVIVAGNVGTFVDRWSAELARDAQSRRLSPDMWTGLARPVLSHVQPGRRRDVIARVSVTKPLGAWRLALQETATFGRGPGGLIRSWRDDQLVERLAHDRSLWRWQTHARLEWQSRAWTFGANYVYSHATDDGIGRIEAPAWSDRRGERAPSTGVARHRAGLVGQGTLPGRVFLIVTAWATSGVPYTLTTGADPEGLRTFSGRVDVQRNAKRAPGMSDLSITLSRRWRLPFRGVGLDAGLRAEHLAGGLAVFEMETVASSALVGHPVRAAHGPRVSMWATLAR